METTATVQEKIVSQTEQYLRIAQLLAEVGLAIESINPNILQRLELLAELTPTVEDEQKAITMARALFDFCADHGLPFSDLDKRVVLIGTLFSDIGKTGPRSAESDSQQRLIVEIFATENVNPNLTVTEFFDEFFPQDARERMQRFRELELDPTLSLREFWNLHSRWTLEIISGDGVPPEAVAAAATHHMLGNKGMVGKVNPLDIVRADGRFDRYFGENVAFDRPEKLIIILDKYDAFRRRAQKSHHESLALLRDIVADDTVFRYDSEFQDLLDQFEQFGERYPTIPALYPPII